MQVMQAVEAWWQRMLHELNDGDVEMLGEVEQDQEESSTTYTLLGWRRDP